MYYLYKGEPVEVINITTREYEIYRYKGRPKHDWVPRYENQMEIPLVPQMEDIIEPDAESLDFSFWKTTPYEHQKQFLRYSQKHAQMLLLDEPGLGKTKQSLDLIANRIRAGQIKKALIIVGVSSLQYNWLNEVKKHTDLIGYILGTRASGKSGIRTKIGSGKDKVDDVLRLKKMNAQIIITNIESLRNDNIVNALLDQVKDGIIGMTVVDEVHKCKNPKAKQTKGLLELSTPYKLGLTGTPIVNSAYELALMYNLLRPGIFDISEEEFNKYFIDETTNELKQDHLNTFQRRILGLTSYYDNPDPNVFATKQVINLDIELPEYQEIINKHYTDDEREQLIKYDSENYMTMSRITCNFAFPTVNGIAGDKRPKRTDFNLSLDELKELKGIDKSKFKDEAFEKAKQKYINAFTN